MPDISASCYPCDFKRRDRVVVGSAADCDIVLPSDKATEAELYFEIKRGVALEVLGRTPVHVDGDKVRTKNIEPGCALKIGIHNYRFELDGLYAIQPGGCIQVKTLSLKRPREKSATLKRVTFEVKSGQMFGIFGPSGCGKSTLLDCLRSELAPTSGFITISSNARVGFVHQENLLYDRLTVEENLRTSAIVRMPDLDSDAIERHIDRVLKVIGLGKKDSRKPCKDLSGGMRKRVNVATELLSMPHILLLDEPTSGLDPATQSDFMGFLKDLSRRCVTVVCVTHAIDTLDYFDRTVFLRNIEKSPGQASIVFRGTPAELHEHRDPEQIIRLFAENNDYEELLGDDCNNIENERADIDSNPVNAGQRGRPFWPAAHVTFSRAWLNLWRTPLNAFMVLALPIILGGLVFLSQAPTGGSDWLDVVGPILLTLAISAIWFGMNLTVREIVSERILCKRELRAGMGKLEYLTGKVLYATLFTAVQAAMILIIMSLLSWLKPWGLGDTDMISPFARCGFWFRWGAIIAIWACSFVGALAGLTISAFSKSQSLAVTLMPLFLIPHLIFNRNIAGDGSRLDATMDQPIKYSPIRNQSWPDNASDQIHWIGSMGLVSRPALHILLSSNPYVDTDDGTRGNIRAFRQWRAPEWLYLFVLIGVHMLILLLTFQSSYRSGESPGLWQRLCQRITKRKEISCANTG